MYFKNTPLTLYSLDNGQSVQLVTSIFYRAVIDDKVKNNYSLYDEYDVIDGETPEILADKFYNNPQLHWVILMFNDIIDPRYDWVLSTNNLNLFVASKYANPQATHHYEDSNKNWVNSTHPNATPISNYMYEERINESKRRIKLLKAEYVDSVVRDITNKFQT